MRTLDDSGLDSGLGSNYGFVAIVLRLHGGRSQHNAWIVRGAYLCCDPLPGRARGKGSEKMPCCSGGMQLVVRTECKKKQNPQIAL